MADTGLSRIAEEQAAWRARRAKARRGSQGSSGKGDSPLQRDPLRVSRSMSPLLKEAFNGAMDAAPANQGRTGGDASPPTRLQRSVSMELITERPGSAAKRPVSAAKRAWRQSIGFTSSLPTQTVSTIPPTSSGGGSPLSGWRGSKAFAASTTCARRPSQSQVSKNSNSSAGLGWDLLRDIVAPTKKPVLSSAGAHSPESGESWEGGDAAGAEAPGEHAKDLRNLTPSPFECSVQEPYTTS